MTVYEDERRDRFFANMANMSNTILLLVKTLNAARKENNLLLIKLQELNQELKKKKNA